jgi:hypothetical protein
MRDLYAEFKPLRDEWEKKNNCKVLYFTNWDYCPLLMKAPAMSVSDLKGKKIRGYGIGSDTIQGSGERVCRCWRELSGMVSCRTFLEAVSLSSSCNL